MNAFELLQYKASINMRNVLFVKHNNVLEQILMTHFLTPNYQHFICPNLGAIKLTPKLLHISENG
jgi:hypothetical protein